MTVARDQKLRRRLEEAFEPQELLVKDQSQLHIGHEGAKDAYPALTEKTSAA